MNFKHAIDYYAEKKGMNYNQIASSAGINVSGFYQAMSKENPEFGWKQLLKITQALGVAFPTLARKAAEQADKEGK